MRLNSVIVGVPSLKKLQGARTDDCVDRLNHVWTVFLMALFAIVVSTSQFVGDPIHCWCPAEFTSAYVDYAKSYCWIKNTYYIPMDTPIPVEHDNRTSEELTYYQWVPLLFLLQAFMFKFPNILWRLFNGGSGINLDKIVRMAEKTQMGSYEDRDEAIDNISVYMSRWLVFRGKYKHRCPYFKKRMGMYLTTFYLFIKVLYAANVIAQFVILKHFLFIDYKTYGFQIYKILGLPNEEWREFTRFPRVTLCDFKIRQHQNIQSWTIQCVLPINFFNEKFFMVVWWWLALVAIMTCVNLISWLYRIIFKRTDIKRHFKVIKKLNEAFKDFDKKLFRKFVREYLRDDGIFVIEVVSKNASDLVATDLVNKLWESFKGDPSLPHNNQTIDDDSSHDNKAAHDEEREALTRNSVV